MKWSSLRPWIARGIKQLKVRDNFGIEGILFCSTPIQGRSESRVLEAIIMPGHSFRERHLSDTGADDKTAFVRYSQLITLPNYTVSLFMSLKAHVAKKRRRILSRHSPKAIQPCCQLQAHQHYPRTAQHVNWILFFPGKIIA